MAIDSNIKPGYKQTELGQIPEDWDYLKIPDMTLTSSNSIKIGPFGSSLKKELLSKSGFKVYGQENIYEKDMSIGDRFLSPSRFRELKSCEVLPGDFLISMMGTVGQCMIVPKGIEVGIMDSHLLRIRFNPSIIDISLASQLFETEIVFNQIKQLSVGGIMEGLSSKIIKSLFLPISKKKAEQTAIASVLSNTDLLIENFEKLITKKKAIKQGTMQQLLTGKKRLPGFSGEWETKKLGRISEMSSGGTPLTSNPNFYNGNIPWVVIADITKAGKYISETEKHISQNGLQNSSAKLFKKGVLLFAMYASIGKCTISTIDMACNQAILGIKATEISTEFLYYFLSFHEKSFILMGQTGTQSNLNKEIVQDLDIPYPKTEEQTAIAKILADMDSEIEGLEKKRDKYVMIKQGMMQQLLTGKIRVYADK